MPREGDSAEPIDWQAATEPAVGRATHRLWGGLLVGAGVVFILLALGLAFTIFGDLSALLGVVCLAGGSVILGRTSQPPRGVHHRSP